MSIRQLVEVGKSGKAEQYLRENEYRSFMRKKMEKPKTIETADYNNVRRKLNLSLSPFITSYENRVTSINRIENPTEKPSRIKQEDIPTYQQLEFTSKSARKFYGQDIVTFFKEKTTGKSKSTVAKYEVGLIGLVEYLDSLSIVSWKQFKNSHAEELISFFYLETNFDASISGAKSFLSVVKSFFVWLDQRKDLSTSTCIKEVMKVSESQTYAAIQLLDYVHPYTTRKYHHNMSQMFTNAVLKHIDEKVEGVYQIVTVKTSSITIQEAKGIGKKYTVRLPNDICEILEEGILLDGTLVKENINAWKIAKVNRVYPGQAEKYLV
jgi:DNA-binding transcriptional regulator YiaG